LLWGQARCDNMQVYHCIAVALRGRQVKPHLCNDIVL
jgi:hypothetical protein